MYRGIRLEPNIEASLVNLFADFASELVDVLLGQNEPVLAYNPVQRPQWIVNVFIVHDQWTQVALDLDL